MNQNRRFSISPSAGLLLAAGLALSATGCANFSASTSTSDAIATGGFTGSIHGGQQPVSGSTVTIYAAGNAGYGSAATALASTLSDAGGRFNFGPGSGHTFQCPSVNSTSASQTLYVVAAGGTTAGVTNPRIVMMAALGDCATVLAQQPQVNIDEVATVAAVFALQQFYAINPANSTSTFGTSARNQLGLANAALSVTNLVEPTSGQAYSTLTRTGAVTGYSTSPVVTITPDTAKINTIANILASCINSNGSTASGSACNTLFTSSNPNQPAADTLQATYNLAKYPTSTFNGQSNIPMLFALSTANPPFQPQLATAPSDWTIAVTFGSSASQTVNGQPVYLVTRPQNLAIDGTGNVWIDNVGSQTPGTPGNSVSELSPQGAPLRQIFVSAPGASDGRLLYNSLSLALDRDSNVYATSFGTPGGNGTIAQYKLLSNSVSLFTTNPGPVSIVLDGVGNLLALTNGGVPDFEAFQAGSTSGTSGFVLASNLVDTAASELTVSGDEIFFFGQGVTNGGTTQLVCNAGTQTTGPGCVQTLINGGGQNGSTATIVDQLNYVYATSPNGILTKINPNSTGLNNNFAYTVTSSTIPALAQAQKLVIDGDANLWITSNASASGSLLEVASADASVKSPNNASGFAHTYSSPSKVAIDSSGNVWIGNAGAAASGSTQGFITEIIGQAGPAITPLAANEPTAVGGVNAGNPTTFGTRP